LGGCAASIEKSQLSELVIIVARKANVAAKFIEIVAPYGVAVCGIST